MKQARYKEPLPLAVIEAVRAGDAGAVEQVLQYYNGYMDKPAFKQLQAQLVKRPPVESLRATGGCTLEIHSQVLKGRPCGQGADAPAGHADGVPLFVQPSTILLSLLPYDVCPLFIVRCHSSGCIPGGCNRSGNTDILHSSFCVSK